MTTLDPKAIEAAKAEAHVIGVSGGEATQVVRIVTAYLSALPAQPVAVKPRWHDVGYLMSIIDAAIDDGFDPDEDGPILDEIRAELKSSPAQQEGVTEEMVERAAEQVWDGFAGRMGGAWPGDKSNLVAVVQCVAVARAALEAALVDRDRVKP